MASFGYGVMVLALCVAAGIYDGVLLVRGDCASQIAALSAQCARYVQKTGPSEPPSTECCNAINATDMPCVCSHVTKEVEQMISMEKVVYCAATCGKPFPHGSKCGNQPRSSPSSRQCLEVKRSSKTPQQFFNGALQASSGSEDMGVWQVSVPLQDEK
ncbi:hypothetical protein Nepgr_017570 [Nepenthes gracilis]|uniref:Bifunctional inhibitor/plant lipid transfer protein/seed storage helical domain-containing protein n=1 Tax=Nepenthes gracilis TaxID=150966 RepID=A0AAD3SRW1_NEPGR|nr:hypothetical protein Nepgr_017570 [Nepenthes gracilis]